MVLVVVTGLLSTYCGFTMWNGVVATADELRRGVATTKVLVAEFGDIEIGTLEVALSAATAQVDALDRELERSTRKALTARSAELELARSALETSFQQLTSETESYRDKAERYENDAKCEIAAGCISGLIGNDAVAMSLSGLAGAYRAAYRTLSDAKRTHELDVAALTKLSGNFDVALESGATLNDLQKSFREMWDQFGVLAAIDVRTPLNNLEASLNAALSSAVKPNPDIAQIQEAASTTSGTAYKPTVARYKGCSMPIRSVRCHLLWRLPWP